MRISIFVALLQKALASIPSKTQDKRFDYLTVTKKVKNDWAAWCSECCLYPEPAAIYVAKKFVLKLIDTPSQDKDSISSCYYDLSFFDKMSEVLDLKTEKSFIKDDVKFYQTLYKILNQFNLSHNITQKSNNRKFLDFFSLHRAYDMFIAYLRNFLDLTTSNCERKIKVKRLLDRKDGFVSATKSLKDSLKTLQDYSIKDLCNPYILLTDLEQKFENAETQIKELARIILEFEGCEERHKNIQFRIINIGNLIVSSQNLTKNLLSKTHDLPMIGKILNNSNLAVSETKEKTDLEILDDLEEIFYCVFLDLYGVDADVYKALALEHEKPNAIKNKKELEEVQNLTKTIVTIMKIDLKTKKKKKFVGKQPQKFRSYLKKNPSDKENRQLLEETED